MVHYFAYGSNLLRERIILKNPSAKFVGIGCLSGYGLVFRGFSDRWNGAVASVEPINSEAVYGVVWHLDDADIVSLDAQESVPIYYSPIEVHVSLTHENSGKILQCRTYATNIKENGLPSPYYLDIILRGAVQARLPVSYLERLKTIRHNGLFQGCSLYSLLLSHLQPPEADNFQVNELRNLQVKSLESSATHDTCTPLTPSKS